MIVFPNCKINLGLYVTGKMPNGYHQLQTCFYPVSFCDALEIIELPAGAKTTLSISGLPLQPAPDNSCLKAYGLLKNQFPQLPPVAIYLHKTIPAGGGLGGGSADAAFTLLLLNQKFQLALSTPYLQALALQLGSDCPFFIINTPCLAEGRGEVLGPIDLDLSAYKIVLVNPGIHVSTGWAFSQIEIKEVPFSYKAQMRRPVSEWKDHLQNVFEPPIFAKHAELKAIKEVLYNQGAVYASMTGSGATVYGLFLKTAMPKLRFPPHYLVKEC